MGATLAPVKFKAAFAIAKATLADCNGLAAQTMPHSPAFRVAPDAANQIRFNSQTERSQETGAQKLA
jgi:hypothetical protein